MKQGYKFLKRYMETLNKISMEFFLVPLLHQEEIDYILSQDLVSINKLADRINSSLDDRAADINPFCLLDEEKDCRNCFWAKSHGICSLLYGVTTSPSSKTFAYMTEVISESKPRLGANVNYLFNRELKNYY